MSIESRTKLTYEDYLAFPDDGRRHEIIDGEHIVTPAPGTYHQTLSKRLQFQLYAQIEERGLGLVFYAPTDVQLSNVDIVQPDLIVLLGARKDLVTPSRIQGSPDVVVEILSESTQRYDRHSKMDAYRRGAVPEYWIVDPDRKVVEVHLLEAGAYRLAEECRDEIAFRRLEGVRIDLKKVW